MQTNKLLIAILAVALAAAGYYIYQDQQKEAVSISIGDQKLSIKAE